MKRGNKLLFVLLTIFAIVGCEQFDDSEIWLKLNNLEQRITSMESTLSRLNTDLNTMSSIVNVLSNNLSITSVTPIDDGFRITFSDGSNYSIKNGTNGVNGEEGATPIIGVREYNGQYCWTQTVSGSTTWITDSHGDKILASGSDGITPLLKVSSDGFWMVSYDQGITYSYVRDARGNLVPASVKTGDSFFRNVEYVDGILTLVLLDGTTIRINLNDQKDERMNWVIPEYIQVELSKYIPIHNGANPPDVQGAYYIMPFVAVYCEDGGYEPGDVMYPHTIRFFNQSFISNTLDFSESSDSGTSSATGTGAFICGNGNNFTAFFDTEGTTDGISHKTALIISGTKCSEGIRDLFYAFVMVEKGSDPNHILMDEGVFRIFKDEDGLSINTTWNPTKSLSSSSVLMLSGGAI